MIRILLVDDQKSIRDSLKSQLDTELDIEVVGTADNGKIAIQQVANLKPDVVIIDMEMPGMDGISATKIIRQRFPCTKILVLSSYDKNHYIQTSLNAGAMGYLLKGAPTEELRESIRFVNKGYTQLSPGLMGKVIQQVPTSSELVPQKESPTALVVQFSEHQLLASEHNPESLSPIRNDELLPDISRWATLGGIFLIGTVITVVALSAVTQYKVVVKAPAIVRPAGEIRLVQAATQGTVKSITSKENQVVQKGDAIATIDDSQLQTQKSQLIGNIQQNQLQLGQLSSQISALDRQILAETNRSQRAVASAIAELESTHKQYQQGNITANSNVQEAQANIKIAQVQLQRVQSELKSAQANVKATEAALQAATTRYNRYKTIALSGSISQNQLEEAQLAMEQQKQALLSQKATVESQKQAIKKQQQAINAAIARHKRTLAVLNPNNAVIAVAKEKIAQERATGNVSLARLKQERKSLLQRQIAIQNQIDNGQKGLKQIERQLQATVITAPEAGTILKLQLRNSGQVVSPGEAIAQIAPSNAPLLVKARITAENISKVKVCKAEKIIDCQQGKVHMRISAYPYPDYGILLGAVRGVTADTITPQTSRTIANGIATTAPYYEVTIQPDKLYLTKGDHSYPIQPGMEVRAEIISQQETFLTFVLRKARLMTNL